MVIVGNNPLYGRFDEMLDNVLYPRAGQPGVLYCADLYCGDGATNRAASATGVETVYAYTLDEAEVEPYLDQFNNEPFTGTTGDSVRLAPEFDLLFVRIDENALTPPPQSKRGRQRYDAPVEHALRFMRVRQPLGILFWGRDLPDSLIDDVVAEISEDAERLGYCPQIRLNGNAAFIAAVRAGNSFSWPDMPSLENVIAAMKFAILRMV